MSELIDRTGETNIATNGQLMTIIAYHNWNNVDIQFDDTTIVKHKNYSCFKKGTILNPNIKVSSYSKPKNNNANKAKREKHIGETLINRDNHSMTIIKYNNVLDVIVEFDDHTKKKTTYYNFLDKNVSRKIVYPEIIDRTGETKIANNGQKMTIIKYRNAKDIDVQFEDGTIYIHRKYRSFKDGSIGKNNKKNNEIKSNYIGKTNIANNGQLMTIISYRNAQDIDIKFEDGTIITNRRMGAFKKGQIANPNITIDKIGETSVATNGQTMTIIAYRGKLDIDVQFEDGTIVYNKSYYAFKNGEVKNPLFVSRNKNIRIGETNIANNGLKMTIIAYRNTADIDIQFEDGIIIQHKSYDNFKRGRIKHPNINIQIKDHTNEIYLNKNGLNMKIIKYITRKNCDIQFETGYIINHTYYYNIKKSSIKHPFPYQMDNILIEKPAYICNNIGNFYCTCTKCNHKDIWTIEEAKNHICKE